MNRKQHEIDMLEAIAADLESHFSNGSDFIYEAHDGIPYNAQETKWREYMLRKVIESLRARADRRKANAAK